MLMPSLQKSAARICASALAGKPNITSAAGLHLYLYLVNKY
jgi:hypothetical protein